MKSSRAWQPYDQDGGPLTYTFRVVFFLHLVPLDNFIQTWALLHGFCLFCVKALVEFDLKMVVLYSHYMGRMAVM